MPKSEPWAGGDVDVAIIGAGAAGLTAASYLRQVHPGLSVLILEAGNRIGGRAWTIQPAVLGGEPVDLGCGWLHGARTNEWTRIASELGITVDRTAAPWDSEGRQLGLAPDDQKAANTALDTHFERVEQRGEPVPDGTLADVLEPGNAWNGLIGAVGSYITGAELANVSLIDYNRYDPGPGPDWRLRHGYGNLIAAFGRSLPVSLRTVVTKIDHREADFIRVETDRGTLRARSVVVTVSTNMLAREVIRFEPALPDKTAAAASLPLGIANKLFLHTRSPDDFSAETRLIGNPHRSATAAYQIRPFGAPLIGAYFGGDLAGDLERAGDAAAFDFALEELTGHFGHGIRDGLELAAFSGWEQAPHIAGAYSYAKPGAANARAGLAAPVNERLFFAGEACSFAKFSTAHGAYETGIAAAKLAALK